MQISYSEGHTKMVLWAFLILLFSVPLVTGQHCAQNQKTLLLELKNNLTYDASHSTKLVQWNESVDCCQWGGVKCDFRGRVTALDLSMESITSGIDDSSTSLFKLEFLQSLSLAQNSFNSVQLPPGFGLLTGLSYLNLSNSNFSGQIPPEFSNLTRLVVLDLSSYHTPLKIESPDLETLIHNFTQLRELYLDYVNISANAYQWCNAVSSSLPNLRVLSLIATYITGPFDPSLAKLQQLSVISLDENNLSSSFPEFFADFSNLKVLTMTDCNLFGVTPARLFQKVSLQTIGLSGNKLLEGSLPEFPVNASLQNLWLSGTNFSGNVPKSIGNLKMLSQLVLNDCRFSGSIPNSLQSLTKLNELDLSGNQFIGHVPSFALLKELTVINLRANGLTGQIPDSLWEGLENLSLLDLSQNTLEGEIPVYLFVMPSLKVMRFSNNGFYGPIRDLANTSYSLEVIDLSVNKLEGPIPQFFFELNLSSLSLSSNRFNGSLDFSDFQKLSSLSFLDLSYNNLSVIVDENLSMSSLLPRLGHLALASCKLQKVPLLKNQSSLLMLDFSDNELNGEIPSWIWEVGNGFLNFLNLSKNHFTSIQEPYDLGSLSVLDLHSNMLGGQIPVPPSTAALIDFSSNNFSSSLPESIGNSLSSAFFFSIANNYISGAIPPSLCNTSYIQMLDISNNSLHGRIPPSCLVAETLMVLNLRRNNLGGDIPDIFPISCGLKTLDLSWNSLKGKVPISLSRCSNMVVLNLGNNKLNDAFPCSFKNLSALRVLELPSNTFYGNVNCLQADNFTWPNLQIFNLASNNFNGVLPGKLFRNMKAMMVVENDTQSKRYTWEFISQTVNQVYYQDSVTATFKGQDYRIDNILTVYTSIDFSNNHFDGAIAETIGELQSLFVLNLSRNSLSGQIPSSVGNLRALETLDLAFNHLSGEIPQQLSSLTYLPVLNLSYNELVGRIPQGNQMNTFKESSFLGNEGLCGFPLNISCSLEVQQSKSGEQDDSSGSGDVYISAALGFLVGLGVIFVPILFSRRWSKFYNKHVNKLLLLVLPREGRRRLEKEDW